MKPYIALALIALVVALTFSPLLNASQAAQLRPGDFEVYNVTMTSYTAYYVTNTSYEMVPYSVVHAFYFINVTKAFNNGTVFLNFTEYVYETEFLNLTTGKVEKTLYNYTYLNITTLDNATAPGLMYYIAPQYLGKDSIRRGLGGANPPMVLVTSANGTYVYEWQNESQALGVKLAFIIYVNGTNGVVYRAESLQYSLPYNGSLIFNATYVLWKSNLANPNATPPHFEGYKPLHLVKVRVRIVPVQLILAGIIGAGVITILVIILFWYNRGKKTK